MHLDAFFIARFIERMVYNNSYFSFLFFFFRRISLQLLRGHLCLLKSSIGSVSDYKKNRIVHRIEFKFKKKQFEVFSIPSSQISSPPSLNFIDVSFTLSPPLSASIHDPENNEFSLFLSLFLEEEEEELHPRSEAITRLIIDRKRLRSRARFLLSDRNSVRGIYA